MATKTKRSDQPGRRPRDRLRRRSGRSVGPEPGPAPQDLRDDGARGAQARADPSTVEPVAPAPAAPAAAPAAAVAARTRRFAGRNRHAVEDAARRCRPHDGLARGVRVRVDLRGGRLRQRRQRSAGSSRTRSRRRPAPRCPTCPSWPGRPSCAPGLSHGQLPDRHRGQDADPAPLCTSASPWISTSRGWWCRWSGRGLGVRQLVPRRAGER